MMKQMAILIMMGLIFLTACGASSSGTSDSSPDAPLATVPTEYAGKTNPYGEEMAAEGAKLFQTNCEMCHGPQGHGDGPAGQSLEPKPKNLVTLQKRVGDDYLFWRISEGKPGTSMVAWMGILDEQQIWQIVSFLRTLNE